MTFLIQFLACVSTCWEWTRRICNTLRVRLLVPNIVYSGYDMILTPIGYWTPVHRSGQMRHTDLIYDAVAHRVTTRAATTMAPGATAWRRWEWIGAVGSTGVDYGNFFADLRVERGQRLTPAQAVSLAVHQTGCWPGVTMRVTTRMGEEIDVLAATGEPNPAAPTSASSARYHDLDYIR
jgi:hypothetical protein